MAERTRLKGLPQPPPGHIYRLWAEVAGRAVPCGDFRVRRDGAVTAQFPVPVETYTAPLGKLFVTEEPEPPPAAPGAADSRERVSAALTCVTHATHAPRMSKMLQVRNVPDRLHRTLRERAARRGKTLSTYVLEELERLARQQPLEEWLDDVHGDSPTRLRSRVVDLVRREREAR